MYLFISSGYACDVEFGKCSCSNMPVMTGFIIMYKYVQIRRAIVKSIIRNTKITMKVKDKKIKNKADFKDKSKILKINTEIKNRAV